MLLAAGTDPDAADGIGGTALHWAAFNDHEEAVGALAEGGADLDKTNKNRTTPLMDAASKGHSGVARRLLELGADHTVVGTGDWYQGKTALMQAQLQQPPSEGKEEAAAVLREWAASHPDLVYDARVAAFDAAKAEERLERLERAHIAM